MIQISHRVLRTEMTGAAFMVFVGSALHFAFGWSGGYKPLALIAAVNESVWEHLKLAFWPGLAWTILVAPRLDIPSLQLLSIKGFTVLITAILIVGIFTSYTEILGQNLLPLDIGTFVLAIVAGQVLSVWIISAPNNIRQSFLLPGLVLLALQLVAYTTFTYFPPDHWLFIDPRNGLAGIPGQ